MGTYVKNVRELRVYQEAFAVSLEVHEATLAFPKAEQYALADQMRRASKSVCVNLAEGFAKQAASAAEFKRFIMISAGSCAEMSVWIDYAKALRYITQETAERWAERYDYIARMLQKLRTNAESSNPRVLESSKPIESSNPRVLESSEA